MTIHSTKRRVGLMGRPEPLKPTAAGRTTPEQVYRDEAGNEVKLIHEAVLEVKPLPKPKRKRRRRKRA